MASEQQVSILINAKDNATKVFNSLDGKLNSFGKAFGTVMKTATVAAGVAGTALVAFGVSAVRAFADSEAQMARFKTTMANVPGVTKEATDALLKSADAAVKLGFSDETAAESLAKFFAATKSVTESQRLNTIAMDVAAGKNIDLAEANRIVTLALAGSTKELKLMGIEVDETMTSVDALNKIEDFYAGQAAARAKTIQGQLMILSESWGNLKEKIGAIFAPYVTKALEMVISIVDKFQAMDLQGTFSKWKDAVVNFAVSLNDQFELVEHFQAVWQVVVDFFNTYLKPSWDSLVETIKENKDLLLTLLEYFIKFLAVIAGGAFIAAMTAAVVILESMGLAIKWLKWFTDSLADAFIDLGTQIDKIVEKFNNFFNKAKQFGSNVGSSFTNAGSNIKWALGLDGTRAGGGPVSAGGSYLVGENGPEVFMPSSSGSIIPNRGAGAITINISGNTLLDEDAGYKVGQQIMKVLKMQIRI